MTERCRWNLLAVWVQKCRPSSLISRYADVFVHGIIDGWIPDMSEEYLQHLLPKWVQY